MKSSDIGHKGARGGRGGSPYGPASQCQARACIAILNCGSLTRERRKLRVCSIRVPGLCGRPLFDRIDRMIWNEQILFIHAPKTGGMSLTEYLATSLPGYRETEKRHETLAEARAVFAHDGRNLEDFCAIFVVIRDPYALEISRYNYLRLDRPVDRGRAQEIALTGDFKRYLRDAPFFGHLPPRLDLYYHEAGYVPGNLTVLRHERLAEEVARHISPFLTKPEAVLPRVNTTASARFEEVL